MNIEHKVAKYLETNPVPMCSCGCGVPSGFTVTGEPKQYALDHKYKFITSRMHDARREKAAQNRIELDDFREQLRLLKSSRNLTWKEMAEVGGISENHLHTLMWGKRAKGVKKEWATDFLKRFAGIATQPTEFQKKKFQQQADAYAETEGTVWW